MNIEKISHWVQIVSGIGLIVGLVLVIMELQQTKDLTRAVLASDSSGIAMDRHAMLAGENPMAILAKACDLEETLTTEDALVLSQVFQSYMQLILRSYEVDRIARFETVRWKVAADINFTYIFSTQAGRDWWKAALLRPPEIAEYAETILADMGPPSCANLVGGII